MSENPVFTFGIIVHKDALALRPILEEIRKTKGMEYEVLIVDNTMNSDIQLAIDGMLGDKERVIYRGENIWFSKSANKILEEARGKYISFICGEHSIIIDPTWANDVVKVFDENEKVGVIGHVASGPGLFHWAAWASMAGRRRPDLTVPSVMKYIMKFPREFVFDQKTQQYIHGGIMVVSREAVAAIGPFDEGFQHALADSEFTLRCILNGWGIGNMEFMYSEPVPGSDENALDDPKVKIAHVYPKDYTNMWSGELV